MDYLLNMRKPDREVKTLIIAFRGWPDAGESATTALKYIVRNLDSDKILDIDPEEFFDFSHQRPIVRSTESGNRTITWPQNELYLCESTADEKSVLAFLGTEPNLKWRTFAGIITELCEAWGVDNVIQLGALMDAVPHTRDTRITGSSTEPNIQNILTSHKIRRSTYQGTTGITTAISSALNEKGIRYTSIWGHTPHYLQAAPNHQISYHIVSFINRILDLNVDLKSLKSAEAHFRSELQKVILDDDQIGEYVKNLENKYDETSLESPLPEPSDLLSELEEYLKNRPQN